ncbi:MAG: hypothetical protein IPP77_02590 [Bacteroidetes bacterium]|nr:hypothetical protein [Bacteroidota bacterium]
MKKGIILTLGVGVVFALTTIGCGTKYASMNQEQITAKADSIYTAQSEAKMAELKAACESSLDAQVNAKVEAMKAAATVTN